MNELRHQRLLILALALGLAVVTGWNIAEDQLLLPTLVGAGLSLWILARFTACRADALVAGVVLFGYLTGNRGFAQLHVPGVPLLPGEAALLIGLGLLFWQSARSQVLPVRRDALNLLIFLWLLLATARLPFDLRAHGIMALRDFAMAYYALFFYLGQAWARESRARTWVRGAVLAGLALTTPVFVAFERWPDFFTTRLTLAGVPIVFVKSDVAGGFMAAGTVWFAHRFAVTRRVGWVLLAAVALAGVFVSNSRAAIVGLAAGLAWVALARLWPTVRVVLALGAVGLAGLAVHAVVTPQPLSRTPLYRVYEGVASMVDVTGTRQYRVEMLADKPDNNQFRLVWWRTVVHDTWRDGRWFGLGFGADLAEDFLRAYYGEADQEFTARSPHSFLMSVFGRLGLTGTALLLAMGIAVAFATWREARAAKAQPDVENALPLWLGAWCIFASACFGVVLEGPMGAAVFWTLLGLANGSREQDL